MFSLSRSFCVPRLLALLAALLITPTAMAAEMWVAPADKADKVVGNWALSGTSDVHFVFAVPDNFDSLLGASIVLLGKKDGVIEYELNTSVGQHGTAHDVSENQFGPLGANVLADYLSELDITAMMPALAAGTDYVAVHFESEDKSETRVVGLRLVYDTPEPLANLSCGANEVLVGFAGQTNPSCVSRDDLMAGARCASGQLLAGYDAGGAPRCSTVADLVAGLGCPADTYLTGFADGSGDPVCATLNEIIAAGG